MPIFARGHYGAHFMCIMGWYTGLAGLRVGYGAFPLSIIQYLWRAKQPYNVSVAAEVSACAALQNPNYLEVHWHIVCYVS